MDNGLVELRLQLSILLLLVVVAVLVREVVVAVYYLDKLQSLKARNVGSL